MIKKNAGPIAAGILLGLLAAWWVGLFDHPAPPAALPVAPAKPPDNPFISTQPAKMNLRMAVAPPVLPPVPASESPPPVPSATRSNPAGTPVAPSDTLTQQARVKAITNNLRQLATAASQYMLDKGVTSAGYFDLVGDSTDDYIRSINPVMGEDYTGIFVSQTDTQVMVVTPDGTTVTYNM